MTYLTVPISAPDIKQASQQVDKAANRCDALELRTDFLALLTDDMAVQLIASVRKICSHPIIVTCRCPHEGGQNNYQAKLRLSVLIAAIDAGAEFIDCEFANFSKEEFAVPLKKALKNAIRTKLILSAHDFDKPFTDLPDLHSEIKKDFPAAIPKIVYKANHINDSFAALDLLHQNPGSICLSMGQPGVITRILAKKLNALVTFASLDQTSSTAPGQVSLSEMNNLYHFRKHDFDTKVFGIIADPVGHSVSPAVHNALLKADEDNAVFLPLLTAGGYDEFAVFMQNVLKRPWLDFKGFCITIPHKTNALRFAREFGQVDKLAGKIGASNTLIIDNSKVKAFNTDYQGTLGPVKNAMQDQNLKNVPVAVIGAGGVAHAVVAAMTDAGADVTIYNRTVEKACALAETFSCNYAGLDKLSELNCKLLINCTSVGMHPHDDNTPVPGQFLNPQMTVFDSVYNPLKTLLIRQAEKKGCKIIHGTEMFIHQAIAQYKLFTNRQADIELIRKTLSNCLVNQ